MRHGSFDRFGAVVAVVVAVVSFSVIPPKADLCSRRAKLRGNFRFLPLLAPSFQTAWVHVGGEQIGRESGGRIVH